MPSKVIPGPLSLADARYDTLPPRLPFAQDLSSPRTGEVPPALSPLDAFAQQSRLLAAKFDVAQHDGRRMSRLPSELVSQELANRPEYFRSFPSDHAPQDVPQVPEEERRPGMAAGLNVGLGVRPVSQHVRLSTGTTDTTLDTQSQPYIGAYSERPHGYGKGGDGSAIPRRTSPEPLDPRLHVEAAPSSPSTFTSSIDSYRSHKSSQTRTFTDGSAKSQRFETAGLAPPHQTGPPKSPRSMHSMRSGRSNSGDDETSSSNGSVPLQSRKFSAGSSVMSRPHSPFSPWVSHMDRSPSVTSNSSMAGSQQLPRPHYNFSRPLSSHSQAAPVAGRPSFESRASFDARPSFEKVETPHMYTSATAQQNNGPRPSFTSHRSRPYLPHDGGPQAGAEPGLDTPSALDESSGDYFSVVPVPKEDTVGMTATYATYSLPRGRSVNRTSAETRTSWIHKQFDWDRVDSRSFELPRQPFEDDAFKFSAPPLPDQRSFPYASAEYDDLSQADAVAQAQERLGRLRPFASIHRSHSADANCVKAPPVSNFNKYTESILSEKTTNTDSTERTLRPSPLHQRSASAQLTADEHLEIGIQAHQSNELRKSTYHLRLAAKAGLPTAMLLYALACRHGWGMRANQQEGVTWLKKAIDSSQLEVANIDATLQRASRQLSGNPVAEMEEITKRKAQLTHAIYELGQSYMNGWGCPKDTALALQCYEVAGSWGDGDCLAEAGYCYTKGIGARKDLKKGAALYRKAAEAGVNVAGNSWIYKAKYMDTPVESPPTEFRRLGTSTHNDFSAIAQSLSNKTAEQRPQSRQRSRSLWGRKKTGH